MRSQKVLVVMCLGSTLIIGCQNKANKSGATSGSQSGEISSGTGASSETMTKAAPLGDDKTIGVPECDEYVRQYLECIKSKVPSAARDQIKSSFDMAVSVWQKAATTPEGRASLAMACQQAKEAARTGMKAYGCSF